MFVFFANPFCLFFADKRPEAAVLLQHPYLKTAAPQANIKKLLVDVFRAEAMKMF